MAIVYRLLFILFAESRGMLRESTLTHGSIAEMLGIPADLGLPCPIDLAETGTSDLDLTQALECLCDFEDGRTVYSRLDVRSLGETYEFLMDHSPSPDGEYRLEHIGRGKGRRPRGSYYTPRYVVDQMLHQALEPVIHPEGSPGLSSDEILVVRVIDPPMGSGNFLIAATEYLADAYVSACMREGKLSAAPAPDEMSRYRAMVAENCIHGIDLDPIAVEIARLSLLISSRLSPETARAVCEHLRNGDALTASSGDDGAFDAVIGNPPYIASYSRMSARMPEPVKSAHASSSRSLSGRINTFPMFVERGLELLRPGGMLALILPKPMLLMNAYTPLRRMLVPQCLRSVTLCRREVFQDAHVASVIITARKPDARTIPDGIDVFELASGGVRHLHDTGRREIICDPQYRIAADNSPEDRLIQARIRGAGVPLSDIAIVGDGINPGPLRKHLISETRDTELHVPVIEGRDIRRYERPRWAGRYILWDPELVKRLQGSRRDSRAVLGRADRFMTPTKIVTRQTAREIIAALDTESYFCTNSVHTTRLRPDAGIDVLYLLGILNSSLMRWYYTHLFDEKGRSYPQVKIGALRQLPIHIPSPAEAHAHDEIVSLVSQILDAKGHGGDCTDLEAKADEIVWGLYGVSPNAECGMKGRL